MMAVKGTSQSTGSLLEKLKKGYASNNQSPASSSGKAVKESYKDPGYTSTAREVIEDYLKRDDFKYNVNTDKFYSMYADKYKKEGERAMRDTVANAAALTGGNPNSYAVNAGAQAYMSYLDELNDILPELEARAYERYLDEGENVSDQVALLLDMDENHYEKYRDSVEDYFDDREFYEDNYRYREDADMDMYRELNDYLLELAGLESDSYFDEAELALALEELALKSKQ